MIERVAFLLIGLAIGRVLTNAQHRNKQLEADLAAAKRSNADT